MEVLRGVVTRCNKWPPRFSAHTLYLCIPYYKQCGESQPSIFNDTGSIDFPLINDSQKSMKNREYLLEFEAKLEKSSDIE
jgi:hypothetical protein